jgi:group I intron endonuclease
MYYVYRIVNKLNSKTYVGKARDPLKRFRGHIKIAKGGKETYPRKFHAIHAAIVKYGIENFSFEIIHEVDTEQEAFDFETAEIAKLRAADLPTYNLSDGGEGNSGWHHTDSARKKMSIARKGRTFTNEHKLALSLAQSGELHPQYGKHQSTQWKENKAKLKADQVREIRKLIVAGIRQKVIANQYGVNPSTISQIKRGKIWNDVS